MWSPSVPELFHQKPSDTCSKAYHNLYEPSSEGSAQARRLCEELWRDFYDLADSQFRNRFPDELEFHQRWFEMYLGATLRRAGLNVTAPKPGPDVRVLVDGAQIYIEAVAPTGGHPLHADAVYEPVYVDSDGTPRAVEVPSRQITLRVANAFREKADAFDGYRHKGYVGVSDPCIIAINLHDIPHAWADPQEYWHRSLYGVGNRFIWVDQTGHAVAAGREHRAQLMRATGAKEDVAPLLDTRHAGISGVLGSAADAGNVPNPIGDDFQLMPHAAAQSPYPKGLIKRGVELVLHPVMKGQNWDIETIDYGAHETRGPVTFSVEFEGVWHQGEWSIDGRNLSVRIKGRRLDFPIQGGDDPAALAKENAVKMLSVSSSRHR